MVDYLYTVPNSTDGLDAITVQTITQVPGLIPMLLFFVFMVIGITGSKLQRARTGTADYPMWFLIGSLSSLMVVAMASLSIGFIRLDWLVEVFIVTILCGVWLFLDRKNQF